jgi:threonine/homoserine/homoserine lactone efflux protein
MLLSTLLPAFLLGIAYCVPPGAVNIEAMRRGLAHGFFSALRLEIGSLVGDAAWALLALSGAAFIAQNAIVRLALGVFGILFLLHLAFQALRDAHHGRSVDAAKISGGGDFSTGMMLSLSNPFAIAFWLGVGTTALYVQNSQPQFLDFALFFAAYMTGAVVWAVGYSVVIGFGKRFATPALFRWIDLACGISLLYLCGHFAWQLIQGG